MSLLALNLRDLTGPDPLFGPSCVHGSKIVKYPIKLGVENLKMKKRKGCLERLNWGCNTVLVGGLIFLAALNFIPSDTRKGIIRAIFPPTPVPTLVPFPIGCRVVPGGTICVDVPGSCTSVDEMTMAKAIEAREKYSDWRYVDLLRFREPEGTKTIFGSHKFKCKDGEWVNHPR